MCAKFYRHWSVQFGLKWHSKRVFPHLPLVLPSLAEYSSPLFFNPSAEPSYRIISIRNSMPCSAYEVCLGPFNLKNSNKAHMIMHVD